MKPTRMQTNMRRTYVVRPTVCSIFFFPTWHLWSHWTAVPWVPEVFLARGGNFRCWPKADTSSAVGRSHEPDRNRAKKSLWHPGGQGFESHTSLNFSWLSFAAAKNCVKNAMIFFHIIQLTLLKVLKTFEANVSAAHSWVRCLTHGAFHVPYTTCIPEIGVLVSQSFRSI